MATLAPSHERKESLPSIETVRQLLFAEIYTYDRVYLVLDGLDETSEDVNLRIRDDLTTFPSQLSILFTSRNIFRIAQTFASDESIEVIPQNDDIWKYIRQTFQESNQLREVVSRLKGIDENGVGTIVVQKARGMYDCQFLQLLPSNHSPGSFLCG